MTNPKPRRRRDASDDPGTIYFLQAVGGGPVKIGWTGGDLNRRIRAIQCACPFELALTRSIPGTRGDERRLHHQHRHDRMHGEWFYPSDAVADAANAKGEEALIHLAAAAYDALTPEERAR